MVKALGVIPARWNSSRFVGKPIVDICGLPMIIRVYNQVIKTTTIDKVVIATDDKRISDVCEQYGVEFVMTTSDCVTGTDRMKEVADIIDAEIYVNIQGDEPLIDPNDIDILVNGHVEFLKQGVDCTNAYVDEKNLPFVDDAVKVSLVKNSKNRVMYFSRAKIPFTYNEPIHRYSHLGLYAMSKQSLQRFYEREQGPIEKLENVEMLRLLEYGDEIGVVEVFSGSKTVDYPEDVAEVERIINNDK